MDGLKGVTPYSCVEKVNTIPELYGGNTIINLKCEGCEKEKIKKHTGTYCMIKDWSSKDKNTGKTGRKIRYIDLINK